MEKLLAFVVGVGDEVTSLWTIPIYETPDVVSYDMGRVAAMLAPPFALFRAVSRAIKSPFRTRLAGPEAGAPFVPFIPDSAFRTPHFRWRKCRFSASNRRKWPLFAYSRLYPLKFEKISMAHFTPFYASLRVILEFFVGSRVPGDYGLTRPRKNWMSEPPYVVCYVNWQARVPLAPPLFSILAFLSRFFAHFRGQSKSLTRIFMWEIKFVFPPSNV
jgi:hypothetical protein